MVYTTNNRWFLWTCMTFALLSLGCQLVSGLGSSDNPAAQYGVNREEALFIVGGQPLTLDPARTLTGPDGVVGHVFSGLVQLDSQLQIQPDLAAGWTISQDGTIYTFYLRKNAVFHDGHPVTAHDLLFSWERATDPETESEVALTYLGDIVGVPEKVSGERDFITGLKVINDYTFQVQIDTPKIYFLGKLTMPVTMVVDSRNVGQANWEKQVNGSGPFKLKVWQDDEIIVLERNELYYRSLPPLAHVVILMGAGIPLNLYETGAIDLVGVGGSTLERVGDPNNSLSAELQTGVDFCTSYVGFNTTNPPFDDARVRRAFVMAIDREQLAITLSEGQDLPALGLLPPGMPGFGAIAGTSYDPDQARQLLAEAGYPNPEDLPPILFSTSGYGDPDTLTTALITRWRENLGVEVIPQLIDPYQYSTSLYETVGNLYNWGWCADYPDAENFLDVLFYSDSPQNFGGFHNSQFDNLLLQARSEPDSPKRLALYQQAEQLLMDEMPAIFISYSVSAVLVKPYLNNYHLTPIGIPQWHLLSRQE